MQTPHLDLLAYQGVRFDNAYADCPVCIPARSTLISGRRAHELGCCSYSPDFRMPVAREDLLGSLLTSVGYQTELVGKTHWFLDPSDRGGFEHVTWFAGLRKQQLLETGRPGLQNGLGYNEFDPALSAFPPHLNQSNWAAEQSNRFLETHEEGTPLALWLSVNDPHPPMAIHEPYFSLYAGAEIPEPVIPDWIGTDAEPLTNHIERHAWNKKPFSPAEVRRIREVYLGMVTNLDHQIGRVIAQLQMLKLWENTLVIYTSDHGEMLGDCGAFGKRSFLEASAKVPMIVRPPVSWGVEPGRVCSDLVEWADVLPTLCEAVGAEVPESVTGRSMLPSVRGEAREAHLLHGQLDERHMLHDGRFKYLWSAADGRELCFDSRNDPHDEHPLDGEPLERMRGLFKEQLAAEGHEHLTGGELVNEDRPRPSLAELRARDSAGLGATEHLGQAERGVMWIG